jgi:hypothetical protein
MMTFSHTHFFSYYAMRLPLALDQNRCVAFRLPRPSRFSATSIQMLGGGKSNFVSSWAACGSAKARRAFSPYTFPRLNGTGARSQTTASLLGNKLRDTSTERGYSLCGDYSDRSTGNKMKHITFGRGTENGETVISLLAIFRVDRCRYDRSSRCDVKRGCQKLL